MSTSLIRAHELITKETLSGKNYDSDLRVNRSPLWMQKIYDENFSELDESVVQRPSFSLKGEAKVAARTLSDLMHFSHTSFLSMFANGVNLLVGTDFLLKWHSLCSKQTTKALSAIESRVKGNRSKSAFFVRDEFDTKIFVNEGGTTAIYDPILKAYTNTKTAALLQLFEDDIETSATSEALSIETAFEYNSDGKEDDLISAKIGTQYVDDIIYYSVRINEERARLDNYSFINILFSSTKPGAEQVILKVESNGKLNEEVFDVRGESLSLRYRRDEKVDGVQIVFVSTDPDSFSNGLYEHFFSIESIVLSSSDSTTPKVVETKKIKVQTIGDVMGELQLDCNDSSLIACDISLKFNGGKSKLISNIRSGQSFSVAEGISFSNQGDRSLQVLSSFRPYYSRTMLSPALKVVDCSLPSSLGNSTYKLFPREMKVYRDIAFDSLYQSSISSSLSDTAFDGWELKGDYYETLLVCDKEMSVNFGKSHIWINAIRHIGTFEFKPGEYRIRVHKSNWAFHSPNLTDKDQKRVDPLFPYNHRHLIQGFRGSSVYKSLGFIARRRCKYVNPDLLVSGAYRYGTNKVDFIYSVIEVEEGGIPSCYFVFPFDEDNIQVERERVLISGEKYEVSDSPRSIQLSFSLEGGAVLNGYEVSI